MRTTRSLVAATAIGIAAAVAAGPAVAADNVSHAKPAAKAKAAKAKAKAKAKANQKVIKQLRNQNRAYAVWRTRVIACSKPNSGASADLRARAKRTATASAKLRAAALRKVTVKQSTATLRAKKTQLSNATKNLAVVARECAKAGVQPPASVPVTVTPSTSPVVVQVPGGTATAQPVELSLRNLLGGTPIDLSPLLGPNGVLPGTLSLVGLDQVLSGVLGEGGLIGIDVQGLLDLINAGVYDLTSCGLLDLGCIVNSLLGTVQTAVAGVVAVLNGVLGGELGDLSNLLRIERLTDTVIRLVPIGPLAQLLNSVGGIDALLAGVTGNDLLGGLLRLS